MSGTKGNDLRGATYSLILLVWMIGLICAFSGAQFAAVFCLLNVIALFYSLTPGE